MPPGATLVFSAHGVSQAVRHEAAARGFSVFDATCPLVTKVHVEVAKLRKRGLRVHHDRPQGPPRGRGHDGPARPTASTWSRTSTTSSACRSAQARQLAVVTQTTLSVDDAARDPRGGEAAVSRRARAEAAGHLLRDAEPPGRGEGARARRRRAGRRRQPDAARTATACASWPSASAPTAYMVDAPDDLKAEWFEGRRRVGLTAGASAPEVLVQQVIERLRALGAVSVRSLRRRGRDGALSAAQGPRRQDDGHAAERLSARRDRDRGARLSAAAPVEDERRALRRRPLGLGAEADAIAAVAAAARSPPARVARRKRAAGAGSGRFSSALAMPRRPPAGIRVQARIDGAAERRAARRRGSAAWHQPPSQSVMR